MGALADSRRALTASGELGYGFVTRCLEELDDVGWIWPFAARNEPPVHHHGLDR